LQVIELQVCYSLFAALLCGQPLRRFKMASNTVQSVVGRFLRNPHRDEFMVLNPWMDITVAAIVFFRRYTANKFQYASYRDLPNQTNEQCQEYLAAYLSVNNLKWWQIPVSQKQCKGIRPETLARYAALVAEQADLYLDVP